MYIYTLGILEKNNKLLLLLRQNTKFFSSYYGLMGGKREKHESFTNTLIREAHEEIGITITKENLHLAHCLSFENESNEEVLALIFKITDWLGEPVNKEPNKCANLAWFALDELPENIIPRHRQVIEMIQKNILYSEKNW